MDNAWERHGACLLPSHRPQTRFPLSIPPSSLRPTALKTTLRSLGHLRTGPAGAKQAQVSDSGAGLRSAPALSVARALALVCTSAEIVTQPLATGVQVFGSVGPRSAQRGI